MTKTEIKNNLQDFSNNNFLQNSLDLFSTLGYTTKRQYAIYSLEEFKNRFLTNSFNEDKLMFSEWNNAQFLFELQANDLNSEETTITTEIVDNKAIETYWFFAIELKGESYTKKQLSEITREINKQRPIPAFILFKYADKLTFSIIDRRLNKKDDNKDVLEKVVLIKDINYTNPHRAHIDILSDISFENIKEKFNVSNFVELHLNWLKALSVSELNKRFYTELSNWFFWAMDTCQLSKDNTVKDNVMFGIRMVTRIIFDWFIKEKGLVSEKVFDKQTYLDLLKSEYKEQGDLYYKVVLQNLFFGCLSVPMNERRFRKNDSFQGKNADYNMNIYYRYESYFKDSNKFLELVKNIPFVNGGLFECLDDKDNNITVDCFTDNVSRNFLKIPDDIFFLEDEKVVDISSHFDGNKSYKNAKVRGLFPILNSYKFTIDETTPVEEEIALDPELLGRVFENLLAAHNPETKTTARKSTGSYYTPREIVDYMCEQSLINYLKTKVENLNIENLDDKLAELLSYSETHSFNDFEVDELIKAVNEVKILDPACGSGAFPMGLLHKLVHILSKLDPNNEKWKLEQLKNITDPTIIENIEEEFKNNNLDYGRKLYLIQNCIFGVDIQPMATQISRLRFFISLIVDEKVDFEKDNMGIFALPNLETKFVAANTLIGIESQEEHSLLASMLDDLKNQLKECRKKYFNAKGRSQKKKLRDQDKSLREQIINRAKELNFDINKTAKLVSWNPYAKDISSDWFDSKWMFNVEKFDIVIGNPPYGLINKRQNKAETIVVTEDDYNFYKNSDKYASATTGGINIFRLFIVKSIDLLKTKGSFCEIFPLAFVADLSAKKLREDILKHHCITSIEAFPERDNEAKRVFKSAKISACIANIQKSIPQKEFFIRMNAEPFVELDKEKVYLDYDKILLFDSVYYTIPLLSNEDINLLTKVFSKGQKLETFAHCYTGEIDLSLNANLLSLDNNYSEMIKGAIIDRYIKRKKMSQGEIMYLKEAEYLKDNNSKKSKHHFNKRIVMQGITGVNEKHRLKMTIIPEGIYCANSVNYIVFNEDNNDDIYFVLGVLNSKLLDYVFKKFSTNSNVNGYEVDALPICLSDENLKNSISKNVISILDITKTENYEEDKQKKLSVKIYEDKIDIMVYKLYDLSYSEVKTIDPNFSMSEQEYKNFKI